MINGRADIRRRCLHGGCPVGFRHARVNAASGVFFLRWLALVVVVAGLLRWLSTCVARNRVCIPWPAARERASLAELLIHASLAVPSRRYPLRVPPSVPRLYYFIGSRI